MTRRESLTNKLAKREEWAGKAQDRAAGRFATADRIGERFAGGQPIIVGHHSEAGARADQRRIHNAMDKGIEESNLAEHHAQAAKGIARALAHNIFSDDDNAIEALRQRIDKHEAQAAGWVALNAAWRKAKGDPATFATLANIALETAQAIAANIARAYSWEKQPIPSYQLTNMRARIRTDKERMAAIQSQQTRTAQAEAAGGVTIESAGGYSRVTFAEKPSRATLDTLRAAGFQWLSYYWLGPTDKLPAGII